MKLLSGKNLSSVTNVHVTTLCAYKTQSLYLFKTLIYMFLMYHMYLMYVLVMRLSNGYWTQVLIHCGYTYNDTFCFPLDILQGGL